MSSSEAQVRSDVLVSIRLQIDVVRAEHQRLLLATNPTADHLQTRHELAQRRDQLEAIYVETAQVFGELDDPFATMRLI